MSATKILRDRIFIRITKENKESIYSKKIVRDDGTIVDLWKTIPTVDNMDERSSSLTVQTAIVEAVGAEVDWIKPGDTALISYEIFNDARYLIHKDGKDDVLYMNVNTTYHDKDLIAYQTRRSNRDQPVHYKGDINELSSLLGIMRGNEFIANNPYVFFASQSNKIMKVSESGIIYTETERVIEREIIAVSPKTTEVYGLKKGDVVRFKESDSFTIKLDEDHTIDAINDEDIMMLVRI